MNAARRARQKANRASGGGHTFRDHRREPDPKFPGKERNARCLVCRPKGRVWDRSLAGKAVEAP